MLSDAQAQAIHPKYSCWVEASAGTGKTKVLTDRVMSLLLSGVSVNEILCLTFTKAAGAEMAERIRQTLISWTHMDDSHLKHALAPFVQHTPTADTLKAARSLFFSVLKSSTGVRIQTIHGFCQFLLRAFPLEAGLLPHFRVMDESEQSHLLKKVQEDFWRTLPNVHKNNLIQHVSLFQFDQLIPFVLSHRHLLTTASAGKKALAAYLHINGQDAEDLRAFLKKRSALFKNIKAPEPCGQKDTLFLRVIGRLTHEADQETAYAAYKDLFLTTIGQPRKSILSKGFYKENPGLESVVVNEQTALLHFEDQRARHDVYQKSGLIMEVGAYFLDLYRQHKTQQGVVDYDDLIHYATHLLSQAQIKPWVLEKLDYHFHHILVDEAQDTSETQWKLLFQLISEFFSRSDNTHRTLFIVGDPKQSIYSFQGASPKGFRNASDVFQNLENACSVQLSKSYRSTSEVLDLVNYVFQNSGKMGTDLAPHVAHRTSTKGGVVLHPLAGMDDDASVPSPWTPADRQSAVILPRRKVAEQMADQIENWLKKKMALPNGRRIEPRDIMILVRRRDQFMQDMVQALKKRGIPVSGADRISLGDHIFVKDVLALLDILLMPHDDLTLATILKSPFFNLSEAALKKLCVGRPGSLWERLYQKAPSIYADIQALQRQLSQAPYLTNFFYNLLVTQKYRESFVKRMGPGVDDILTSFLDAVALFETDHGPHAAQFLTWMRSQAVDVKRGQESAQANEVRLMTVHAAKGLQAPIVMLPDTTQTPQNRSAFYAQEGLPFLMWADASARRASSIVQSFCAHSQAEAEYQRLLYVALTRAEDFLYIYGWDTKQEQSDTSWYRQIEQALTPLATPTKNGWVYGTEPMATEDTPLKIVPDVWAPLPAWVGEPLSLGVRAPKVTPSQSAPGSFEAVNTSGARDRGICVHHILEHALRDDLSPARIETYINTLKYTSVERDAIHKAVQAVLSHPLLLRKPDHIFKTEVGVQGLVEGRVMNGIMDLIILAPTQKTVWILDYKTGRFQDHYKETPPQRYVHQMHCYKVLMGHLYPTYTIHTGLIWTDIGWLQLL